MRILIVEDDPATLYLLDARVRRWGYTGVTAKGTIRPAGIRFGRMAGESDQ